MSTRWMAVQFVGDTLRLPIVNKPVMDKPFGSSELEREVRRIVVNPFSDNPQTFVPEAEIDKLREMSSVLRQCLEWESCKGCPMQDKAGWCVRDNRLRELGVEVD